MLVLYQDTTSTGERSPTEQNNSGGARQILAPQVKVSNNTALAFLRATGPRSLSSCFLSASLTQSAVLPPGLLGPFQSPYLGHGPSFGGTLASHTDTCVAI